MKLLILFVAAMLYWHFVGQAGGVREPWDAHAYWTLWYPIALVLSAVTGFCLRKGGWLAGPVIISAQLPVMLLNTGLGAMMPLGIVFVCVLAVPSLALSFLAARLGDRHFAGR
jgi:hypothetical protein